MAGELGRSHAAASRQEYSSLLDKGHHTTQGLATVTSMLLSLLDPKVLQPRKERKGWEGVEGERRLKLRFLSLSGPSKKHRLTSCVLSFFCFFFFSLNSLVPDGASPPPLSSLATVLNVSRF